MAKGVFLRLPEDLVYDLERYKPRTMSLTGFCAYLIELGVDRDVTLAERPKGSEASNSSSSITKEEYLSINNKNGCKKANETAEKPPKQGKKRKRPAYSEEFEQLWKLYQSAPDRVSSQTKPRRLTNGRPSLALKARRPSCKPFRGRLRSRSGERPPGTLWEAFLTCSAGFVTASTRSTWKNTRPRLPGASGAPILVAGLRTTDRHEALFPRRQGQVRLAGG